MPGAVRPSGEVNRPWARRSHQELAVLAREVLLAGHLIDRSGMPHLIARFGREAMTGVAINEWMAASPVYTKRMQRLLRFEGDSVEVIFKGMQLDVGAPPEFMDFRYTVHDAHHGEFHLDHCGALMDVEPMGDEYVRAMCHDIEDPTFDATAAATNPRARVRPIHRPPRHPADRRPHCAWTVAIEPSADALPTPPPARRLAGSAAARLPLATPDPGLPTDDGRNDYTGPLDPDLRMEHFSSATLSAILDEVCLQGQLLARAFLLEVADLAGPEAARAIGTQQAAGIAGVTAKRLARALGADADLDGLATVLAAHPLFLPRDYVGVEIGSEHDTLELALGGGRAYEEPDGLTWPHLLADGDDAILEAIAACVAPTASVERLAGGSSPGGDGETGRSWRLSTDESRTPADQPGTVTLTEFSTGAGFSFSRP